MVLPCTTHKGEQSSPGHLLELGYELRPSDQAWVQALIHSMYVIV